MLACKNVMRAGMARVFQCTVKVLDDQAEAIVIEFKKDTKGQYLLDEACIKQDLAEKDYFGLRYIDGEKQRHWLDLKKSIVKQLRGTGPPYTVVFRVKYYPANPDDLKEEITKYQLFLQLKKDLLHGRLSCTREDAALLGSYIVQANLRDYDPEEHPPGYVSEFQIVPKQTEKLEKQIEEFHEKHTRGLKPSDAEFAFIKKAYSLETYGIDPHPVRDIYGTALHIGMNYAGLLVFRANAVVETFKWDDIKKFNYEGRTFFIHAVIAERRVNHGFRLSTSAATKHLWKSALDHQAFYNPGTHRRRSSLLGFRRSSDVSSHSSGGFFRGSRFRFSGRTQREVREKSLSLSREEPTFARSPPLIRPRRVQSFKDTALHPPRDITFDGFAQLSGSDHSTPIKINEPFMTYAPAPSESTDDSDIHADTEDVIDATTQVIEEEPMEQQMEETTEQAMSPELPTENELPSNHVQETQAPPKSEPHRRRGSKVWLIVKLTIWTLLFTLILLAIGLIVLYETEYIPTLDSLRRHQSIRDFREAYYGPVRAWIEGRVEQVSLAYQQLPSVEELKERIGLKFEGESATGGE